MKEIKFRIWNGSKMEYNVTVGRFGNFYVNPENGDGLNPNDKASLTTNTTKYHESAPVMQYTGLKDKNGKEIYEGDIIHISLEDGEKTEVVKWSDDMGLWEPYLEGSNEYYYTLGQLINMHGATVEVIGSIYENPELIK